MSSPLVFLHAFITLASMKVKQVLNRILFSIKMFKFGLIKPAGTLVALKAATAV